MLMLPIAAVYERQGLSEMLQQVARVGRLGSLALPSPTMGISASTINPALILVEYNTLNPKTFALEVAPVGCP